MSWTPRAGAASALFFRTPSRCRRPSGRPFSNALAPTRTIRRREAEFCPRHHEAGDSFLEQGAGPVAADLLLTEGLAPGQTLGAYVVVREIGRGGMGVVYLARDTRLDRDVAIKMLPPELRHNPRGRERLRQEARAAAAVPHAGIAHVYALEEDEARHGLRRVRVRGWPHLCAKSFRKARCRPDRAVATAPPDFERCRGGARARRGAPGPQAGERDSRAVMAA